MFMKINEEVAVSDSEKGFRVVLFDNRKGGKDHGVKLATDLRQTFTRILRSGYVSTNHGTQSGVNADVEYCQFHEVPFPTTGFKIDEVRFHMGGSTDGKQGQVTAVIRPFGPKYRELRDAIDKKEEMEFKLCHTVDKEGKVFRVLNVSYKPRKAVVIL